MSAAKKKTEAPLPEKFEDAMEELDSIVTDMEEAELPLDQLIEKYGRGMKLAAFCDAKLGQAEKQVEVLTSGTAVTEKAAPESESAAPEPEEDGERPGEASLF